MLETTDLGPLASIKQAEEVENQMMESFKMGASVSRGGRRENAFFEPTIVEGITPKMPLFAEEVFGPVAPFMEFKKEEEAVQISNSSLFGLGVTICTSSEERIERLTPQFDEGAVFVNELVKSDPRLPFGGVKRSGYGRELGAFGIREFVNVKTVYLGR